ncbi:Glycoside hydrolase family 13 protein [Mycena venus]|uniref:Glycoside hydrolase family 13 protein n=1 Tax=Mycena venus TaxID=2733690 RepID=A0A8H6X5Q6_9AGAR|nr:Glycoside hydrolase family 13 protein [Mycena venus]
MAPFPETWWKDATVYQIYPTSFFDSNGDGIGDLNGITSKLDYLKDLGVDVLWLNPIYKSPLADMGYDISDYRNIDPRYGTLGDWDRLIAEVHARGMKLMMDLVVNHTSDEHEWFIERSAWEYSAATDEYYLHLYLPKQPDLNWDNPAVREAVWDLMKFWVDRGCDGFRMDCINQISKVEGLPDAPVIAPEDRYQDASDYFANGPHVHEYVQEMNRKVLSRYRGEGGHSSFVVDFRSVGEGAPWTYAHDSSPVEQAWAPAETHVARETFLSLPSPLLLAPHSRHSYSPHSFGPQDLITVGETPFTHSAAELAKYVLEKHKELNMVFQFQLSDLDSPRGTRHLPMVHRPWKLFELKEIVTRWQIFERDQGFWNTVFMENHDISRSVSRFGNDSDEWRAVSAKMLAMLQLTQGGTQYVYQGQELGLRNFPRSWGIEEYKDVASENWYNETLNHRRREAGRDDDVDMTDILDDMQKKARDHSRVPMPWDSSPNAGFTTGTPWMRVNEDYMKWNAANQLTDPQSVHSFWKRALQIRKQNRVLIYGDFTDLSPDNEEIFAYVRSYGGQRALVILNFTSRQVTFNHLEAKAKRVNLSQFKLVFGNYCDENKNTLDAHDHSQVDLEAYEGRLYISGSVA